jgi:hypothetical protein
MARKPDQARASGHVSQNAPEFTSPSHQAWSDALRDDAFKGALDEGLADVKAGRTRPWGEIRRRTTSK